MRLCAFLAPEAIPLDLVAERSDLLPQALAAAADDGEAGIHEAAGWCYRYSLVARDTAGIRIHRLVQHVISTELTDQDRQATIKLAVELLDTALPRGTEVNNPQRWTRFAQLLPHVLVATEHAQRAGVAAATTAILLQRIGAYLWWVRGEFAAAQDILERALPLGEAALKPDHPTRGWILNDLGAVLREQGRPADARAYLERALATWRAAVSPDRRAEATTLSYLGRALHDLGDLDGAQAALSQGLTIRQELVGPNHPEVGSIIGHLGEVLRDGGDLSGAQAIQQQALEIKQATLGPDHPSVGRTVRNLGKVLHDLGDLDGAQAAFEQALTVLEAALGPDHPHVGNACWSLGIVLHGQGDHAAARTQLQRAHAIFNAALGPQHSSTQAVARRLADL